MYIVNRIKTFRTAPKWRHGSSRVHFIFCLLISSLFYLTAASNTANAAIYYVDDANGLDTNPGTEVQPWKTLDRAYTRYSGEGDKVQEGDTVYMRDGDYGAFRESTDDGAAYHVHRTDWITYKAAVGHEPNLTSIYIKNYGGVDHYGDSYLVFDGIKVTNGVTFYYSNYVKILNCTVNVVPMSLEGFYSPYFMFNADYGIYFRETNDITVTNCNISYAYQGIKLVGPMTRVDIIGNEIHLIAADCISASSVRDFLIENNYMYDIDCRRTAIGIVGTQSGEWSPGEVLTQAGSDATGVYDSYNGQRIYAFITSEQEWAGTNTIANGLDEEGDNGTITGATSGTTFTSVGILDPVAHSECFEIVSYNTSYNSQNVTIRGNRGIRLVPAPWMQNSQASKIEARISGEFENLLIENNVLVSDTRPILLPGVSNFTLRNNTLVGGGATRLHLTAGDPSSIIDNMYNNIFSGFILDSDADTRYCRVINHGNNIFGNDPSGDGGPTYPFMVNGTELTNYDIDSLFVDAANNDFNLAPTSVAIDFGDPAYAPPNDILGKSRGTAPDAGCYEVSYISLIPDALIQYVKGTLTTAEIEPAQDPNGDPLTYTYSGWLTSTSFPYTITSDDVGIHTLHVDVNDGTNTTGKDIIITVDVDSQAPNVTNCLPTDGLIQVPLDNAISIDITDAGIGVDADSVTIKVNDITVYTGDTTKYSSTYGECRRTGTKANYSFTYSEQDFEFDQPISVDVNAMDIAGNSMDTYSYSFKTKMRSFGENKKVNVISASINSRPTTCSDSEGNIWVAWHAVATGSSNNNRDIYIGKLVAEAEYFSDIKNLNINSTDQCNPAIAVDSDDKLYVAWQDNRQGEWDIYVSTSTDGTNWSPETRITDSNNQTNPAMAIDSSDEVHIVYDDQNTDKDIYKASSADNYVSKTQITSAGTGAVYDQTTPDIAVDSDDKVYVVWADARNWDGNGNITYDMYGAASDSWTNIEIVDIDKVGQQTAPKIATEGTGTILHFVWVDDELGDKEVYYGSSDGLPGTPLTGTNIIDQGLPNLSNGKQPDQKQPALAVTGYTGGTGNDALKVFVCWQDERWLSSSGDTDLFFDEITSSSGTDIFVGDDDTNADQSNPAIGIDEYGYPYLVWTDSRNTNTDIYYAGSTVIKPNAGVSTNISISSTTTLEIVDGASVVVPAGAYPCDIKITISEVKNPPKSSKEYLSLPYEFGPSGIEFDQPVTITIPYEAPASNYSVSVYWYNLLTAAPSQQGITDIETIGTSPTLYLRFKTTHFTQFFVGGSSSGGSISGGGGGGGGGCSMSPNSQVNAMELLLPYIGLTITMVVLKLKDRRKKKARNITKSEC